MIMAWTQRDGVKKSVELCAITRLEYVPGDRETINVSSCDILDTICGRPTVPGDTSYVPGTDTAEVFVGKDPETIEITGTRFSVPDELLDLYCYILSNKYK